MCVCACVCVCVRVCVCVCVCVSQTITCTYDGYAINKVLNASAIFLHTRITATVCTVKETHVNTHIP